MTSATSNAFQTLNSTKENTQAKEYPANFGKTLSQKHYQHCCGIDISKQERAQKPEWIKASCYSADIKEASEILHYQAKSPGIIIIGQNGQFQFRPDKPWADFQGKKAPKYRTAYGDNYDALLPAHPEDPHFWVNLEKLKQAAYKINGHPCIFVTEGGFSAIAPMSHGIPTVALIGVEMGLTPTKADPQGKRYLVPSLETLAQCGFGFIMGYDADTYNNCGVKSALIKLAHQLQKFNVPVYCLPEWDIANGKGVDDYIQMNGIEEFRKKLLARAINFENWQSKYATSNNNSSDKIPKADIIGLKIADEYRERWVYCDRYKNWLAYELELPGVWGLVSKDYMRAQIHNILKARGIKGYGSNSYIDNILGSMQRELYLREWNEKNSEQLLPFKNGVKELATGKFLSHSPENRLTWQLPRDYSILSTNWSSIDNWLNEATQGQQQDKHLLLCFAAAVLRGRADLQKFLHLIGTGGSGKSTFTNLLVALIGEENTVTLNLSDLEDKHEIARVFAKRLVVLPDQDKVGKRMSNFKRLTGCDRLSGRRLFENSFEFLFNGMAVITSNFPIFHSNLGSWLIRRQLMLPFSHQCPEVKQRNLMKEFLPELTAWTNYLLSIPIEEIENTLKGLGQQSLSTTAWESLTRSDGLAAWLNDQVILDPQAFTRIGSDNQEWADSSDYDPERSSLYGSYSLYCRQTKRNTLSLQNFSAELIEITQRILKWNSVEKKRIKIAGKTVRVIKGLKLRTPNDEGLTVEEILEGDNQSPSGDHQSDNQSDRPKPPPDIGYDHGDSLCKKSGFINNNFGPSSDSCQSGIQEVDSEFKTDIYSQPSNPETTNKFDLGQGHDSLATGIESKEVQNQISRKLNHPVTSVTTTTNQGSQPVTNEGTSPVTPPVTPADKEDYLTYPHPASKDPAACRNRANKCKEIMLTSSDSQELENSKSAYSISAHEINWVYTSLLTPFEQAKFDEVCQTKQLDIFNQPEPSDNPNEITWDMAKAQIKADFCRDLLFKPSIAKPPISQRLFFILYSLV